MANGLLPVVNVIEDIGGIKAVLLVGGLKHIGGKVVSLERN